MSVREFQKLLCQSTVYALRSREIRTPEEFCAANIVVDDKRRLWINGEHVQWMSRVGVRKLSSAREALRREYPVDQRPGVGMPAALMLDEFASQLIHAFNPCLGMPYLVGSALKGKQWRDVDVRLILTDEEYAALLPGCDPLQEHRCGKWVALCLAFSALGKQMTGLPIDFQIQQMTYANKTTEGEPRSALGAVELRIVK